MLEVPGLLMVRIVSGLAHHTAHEVKAVGFASESHPSSFHHTVERSSPSTTCISLLRSPSQSSGCMMCWTRYQKDCHQARSIRR